VTEFNRGIFNIRSQS